MKHIRYSSLLALLLALLLLAGCLPANDGAFTLALTSPDRITLAVGEQHRITTNVPTTRQSELVFAASGEAAAVSAAGVVTAQKEGVSAVTVSLDEASLTVTVTVSAAAVPPENPSDTPVVPEGFATSLADALDRASRGEPAGSTVVPDQAPIVAATRPMGQGGALICNSVGRFADEDTYIVVNEKGEEVFRIYRGGGYIALEEVAAYLYAFGDIPANYVSNKKTSPKDSIWGEYLRLNHSKFSGSTTKYPYEPMLPRISGCGGDLQYYEIDIGTTGNDCDPSYPIRTYNNGISIVRGAARIVYARFDANGNKVIDDDEKFIFYTYNHYNDFQQYLNYYGGWGDIFGNITGGGKLSSKTDCNPTPYIPTSKEALPGTAASVAKIIAVYYFDPRAFAA